MFYTVSWFAVTPFLRTAFRAKFQGKEHLPKTGPAILASNHLSFLDHLFDFEGALISGFGKDPLADFSAVLDENPNYVREAAAAAAALAHAVIKKSRRQNRIGIVPEQALDDVLDLAASDEIAGTDDHRVSDGGRAGQPLLSYRVA